MPAYIVFVDAVTYTRRGSRIKTRRFEINAENIISAYEKAIAENGGGKVSMIWSKRLEDLTA